MFIERNVSLQPLNSFGMPAAASTLVRIASDADVRRVIDDPELGRQPKFVLGGGSNIVLTRDGSFEAKGCVVCDDFTDAVSIAKEQAEDDGVDEVCVIGGVSLFELALPRARRIYLTEVHADIEGDVTLHGFDESKWVEVRSQDYPAGEGDDHPFTIRVLERR